MESAIIATTTNIILAIMVFLLIEILKELKKRGKEE